MGKTEGINSLTLSSMETPFSSENIFKRELPPVMAGDTEKPLGMDLTVPRKNPSNNDYYTRKNCSGWNQQVLNGQVDIPRQSGPSSPVHPAW
jgi:hypothetical protein